MCRLHFAGICNQWKVSGFLLVLDLPTTAQEMACIAYGAPFVGCPSAQPLVKPHIDSLFTRFQCFVQSFSVVVGICTSSMHTKYYYGGHSAVCLEMVGLRSKCLLWTCLSVGQWWITLDCNKTCTYIFAVVDC